MADSQQILQAIAQMQQVGQERLPVIPNNGNPAGAHNMPQNGTPLPVQAGGPVDKYAWLKPSPAMDRIRALSAPKPPSVAQQPQVINKPQVPFNPVQTKPMQVTLPQRRVGIDGVQPVLPVQQTNQRVRQFEN